MPEGEEEDQEIENLFQKIMNGLRESKKLRVPKMIDPRRNTPRHIIITLARLKIRRDS